MQIQTGFESMYPAAACSVIKVSTDVSINALTTRHIAAVFERIMSQSEQGDALTISPMPAARSL